MNKKEIMDLFKNPDNRRLAILIMGKTGSGKTTLANELFGNMDIYDDEGNDIKSPFASGSRVQVINAGIKDPNRVYLELQETVDIVIYTRQISISGFSACIHKNRLGKMGIDFKFDITSNGIVFE